MPFHWVDTATFRVRRSGVFSWEDRRGHLGGCDNDAVHTRDAESSCRGRGVLARLAQPLLTLKTNFARGKQATQLPSCVPLRLPCSHQRSGPPDRHAGAARSSTIQRRGMEIWVPRQSWVCYAAQHPAGNWLLHGTLSSESPNARAAAENSGAGTACEGQSKHCLGADGAKGDQDRPRRVGAHLHRPRMRHWRPFANRSRRTAPR